jgi:peptidoglycan hydrolase-like protein with peptidoglycan-binding domain
MKAKSKTKNKTGRKTGAAKKQQTKKIIIATVAVGAAGILGYFGWQYLKKKKEAKQGGDLDEILKTTSISAGSSVNNDIPAYTPSKTSNTKVTNTSYSAPKSATINTVFPLKKGSKGENVRLLQEALIAKYGKTILPKYGADGDFGSETANALKKAGLPATINESTFNVLTQGSKPDNSNLGNDLYNATIAKNYNKVLSLLKQMQSVDDYSTANEVFKENRINGVRQTIVNGLLNSFTSNAQKEAIKFEFLRMGLQFDGNKWSLSGFDGKPVVTTEPTTVWVNATEGVNVPARMVLGNEVSRRLDYTLFENNGKYFLVNTKSVQYLN